MRAGEGQRERETESKAGFRLQTVSTEPDTGLKLTNREIMTWAEVRHLTGWAPWAPLFLKYYEIWGAWVAQSVKRSTSARSRSRGRGFEPRVRLWADGSEPGACFRFCVSLSLCPSPVHALSLSVPKINKRWKKIKKKFDEIHQWNHVVLRFSFYAWFC